MHVPIKELTATTEVITLVLQMKTGWGIGIQLKRTTEKNVRPLKEDVEDILFDIMQEN